MPFVPHGRKAQQRRLQADKREAEERVLDRVIGRAQFAVRHAPGHCLPLCFVVTRVLDEIRPGHGYEVRLGALSVVPLNDQPGPRVFDPRLDDGSKPEPGRLRRDAGFHSWLESGAGRLVDPSIFLTLHPAGYSVDREGYVLAQGRDFQHGGIRYTYEVLPELQMVGVAESEDHLARAVSLVLHGHPLDLGPNYLDVVWQPVS